MVVMDTIDGIPVWDFHRRKGSSYCWVRCVDCNAKRTVVVANLRASKSKRCRVCTQKTHGLSRTPPFRAWTNMRRRCANPKDVRYDCYGARGIKVCAEWATPENCRWTVRTIQMRNTQRIRKSNTSGYRGVVRAGKRWKAQIGVDGSLVYLGCSDTRREAAEEYDAYVIAEGLEHTLNFERMAI